MTKGLHLKILFLNDLAPAIGRGCFVFSPTVLSVAKRMKLKCHFGRVYFRRVSVCFSEDYGLNERLFEAKGA
jgi:hypothetical protein